MQSQPLLAGAYVFVEAVAAGGFSAAARRLNRSRSSVGKAIARLEWHLGVRLFHRTTRSQKLTEEGRLFYEHCMRALGEINAAYTMLEAGRNEAVGRLKVSLPTILGRRRVAPVLTALLARHPRLQLDLRFTDRVVDLIAEDFDLAVRNAPLGYSDGLSARRIGGERMVLCASSAYLAEHAAPTTLSELAAHPAVTYPRSDGKSRWLIPDSGNPVIEFIPNSRLRLNDLEAVADATKAGFGIAWLPKSLIEDELSSGKLVQLLSDRGEFVFETYAVWPTATELPLRTRIAIDALSLTLTD